MVKFFLQTLFSVKCPLCIKLSNCVLEIFTIISLFHEATSSVCFFFPLFDNEKEGKQFYHCSSNRVGLESESSLSSLCYCLLSTLLHSGNYQILLKFPFHVSIVLLFHGYQYHPCSGALPSSFNYHGSFQLVFIC